VTIPKWVFEWMSKTEESKSEKYSKNKFANYDPKFGSWIDKAIDFDPRKEKVPKK